MKFQKLLKQYRLVNVVLFGLVAIVPVYIFTIPYFRELYLSTSIYAWLASIIDERVARSALARLVAFVWGLSVFSWWTRYVDGRLIRDSILFQPPRKKLQYFAAGFFVMLGVVAIPFCIKLFTEAVIIEGLSQNILYIFYYFFISAIIFSFNVFIEELIFRGYILQNLALRINPQLACFLSAFLFMVAHPFHSLGIYGVLVQAGLGGLAFAYIALYYRSIYVTFGIHLCSNLVSNSFYSPKIFHLSIQDHWANTFDLFQVIWIIAFLLFFFFHKLWRTRNLQAT